MKPVIFRQLKSFDLNSVYRWVKEIEAEDTFVTMNPNEPLTSKEVKDFIQNQIKNQNKKFSKNWCFCR